MASNSNSSATNTRSDDQKGESSQSYKEIRLSAVRRTCSILLVILVREYKEGSETYDEDWVLDKDIVLGHGDVSQRQQAADTGRMTLDQLDKWIGYNVDFTTEDASLDRTYIIYRLRSAARGEDLVQLHRSDPEELKTIITRDEEAAARIVKFLKFGHSMQRDIIEGMKRLLTPMQEDSSSASGGLLNRLRSINVFGPGETPKSTAQELQELSRHQKRD